MIISSLLHSKRDFALRVLAHPPSQARTHLLNLLRLPKHIILRMVADAWCQREYGISIYKSEIKIPRSLIPNITNQKEFFDWLTKEMRRSIK